MRKIVSLRKILYLILLLFILVGCSKKAKKENFVQMENNHFVYRDSLWFPFMINYKVNWRVLHDTVVISPAKYYENPNDFEYETAHETMKQMQRHFMLVRQLGFNAIRICIDVMDSNNKDYFYGNNISLKYQTKEIFQAIDSLLKIAQLCDLKVMLLIKPPFDSVLQKFTTKLLKHCANNPTLFCYDFINEPLYFDNEIRTKQEVVSLVSKWKNMCRHYAPNQLFTIALSEPIEVFKYDPALLPVDFIQMHTYHPLRIPSELYWYGKYAQKPFMVGEISLPADNDSVPYQWQKIFMEEAFQLAIDNGAIGFGWWEFQDCINLNFEGNYAGLLNHDGEIMGIVGSLKPAAHILKTLEHKKRHQPIQPCNYNNMLGYENIVLHGRVIDHATHNPIEGACIRGWNDDWSVGMNTFSNSDGYFTLYSNDICVHFEVSAPNFSHIKFDRYDIRLVDSTQNDIDINLLKNRDREYQQIDYKPFLKSDTSMFSFSPADFTKAAFRGEMGDLELQQYHK